MPSSGRMALGLLFLTGALRGVSPWFSFAQPPEAIGSSQTRCGGTPASAKQWVGGKSLPTIRLVIPARFRAKDCGFCGRSTEWPVATRKRGLFPFST